MKEKNEEKRSNSFYHVNNKQENQGQKINLRKMSQTIKKKGL